MSKTSSGNVPMLVLLQPVVYTVAAVLQGRHAHAKGQICDSFLLTKQEDPSCQTAVCVCVCGCGFRPCHALLIDPVGRWQLAAARLRVTALAKPRVSLVIEAVCCKHFVAQMPMLRKASSKHDCNGSFLKLSRLSAAVHLER